VRAPLVRHYAKTVLREDNLVCERIQKAAHQISRAPLIGKLEERIGYFAQYGVKECWLIHQLAREIEVLRLQEHGPASRRVFRGIEAIESGVLPEFRLSPEILDGW